MSYGVKVVDGTDVRYRKSGDEAGLAREYVKNSISKKVAFFEETLMEKVVKSGAVEEAEDEALKNDEFKVYLQPKYQYDGSESRIVGAEALVRWIGADGRIKPPDEFIPVFEENGFILELDQFMWEEVCRLLRRWMDEGFTPIPISVNVSRTYLKKFDAVGYIKELVDKYQIPIELLQLEITETTESDETISYVNRFKAEGFTLLMDDFGSGYSSLSMLKDTPFDVLKMDRFFLDDCMENECGKKIVSHVISMSNDLGLDIVAEGVETKEMADFLHAQGCEVSQGYYFSRPISVEEFEKLWKN
jgi:EAL domain-containing protein (putative c-di-GMP-specific phosphodiesterase class I)